MSKKNIRKTKAQSNKGISKRKSKRRLTAYQEQEVRGGRYGTMDNMNKALQGDGWTVEIDGTMMYYGEP